MRKWSSSLAACLCVGVIGGGGTSFVQSGYRVNMTASMPRGIWQETHESIERGSFVFECLPPDLAAFGKERGWFEGGDCPTGIEPILKQVAGIPGDTVDLADEYVAVNDMLILGTATHNVDSKKRPLPAIPRGVFTLKDGEFFLVGWEKKSWDSRYTGPALRENIRSTARPVWVEEGSHGR